ncbi:hypothetical protein [Tichowtungia aerotolerans]|uniref:Uncharacterized protein n=1 Tax=Tichowtungia aerotolerans TaxID=2697043 RepID=A0A6P1MCF1_9BACT|nr:hypothetical protein [Tichowtungia aerotolerans]QHI69276.1 hypothetical protein GT409_07375 [Tichowtungia aerotolerans]
MYLVMTKNSKLGRRTRRDDLRTADISSAQSYWDFGYNTCSELTNAVRNLPGGIPVVGLRMPYHAPENGYQTNWISHAGERQDTGYFGTIVSDETKNYFCRIRTVLDENEKIEAAFYGKIYGAFYVRSALRENPKIIFNYYLNPTQNDRNLEFDPKQNLFGGRSRFAP